MSETARCSWCGNDPIYVAYHDKEWGVPERDPIALFEKLCLDGFQAGLSWIIVLRKREAFRTAFRGFDPAKVARFGTRDVNRLLANAAIIRSRQKIDGAIGNALAWLALQEQQSFADFLWKHVDGEPIVNHFKRDSQIPSHTPRSEAMARDLKAHGFKFCGPTICYAFMQATGMVNDHVVSCPRHAALAKRV